MFSQTREVPGIWDTARAKRKEKWTTTPNHTDETHQRPKISENGHISPTPTDAPQGEPHRRRTRKRRKRTELKNEPSATFHLGIDKLGNKTRVRSRKCSLYGQILQWRNSKFARFWHTSDSQKPAVIDDCPWSGVAANRRPFWRGQTSPERPSRPKRLRRDQKSCSLPWPLCRSRKSSVVSNKQDTYLKNNRMDQNLIHSHIAFFLTQSLSNSRNNHGRYWRYRDSVRMIELFQSEVQKGETTRRGKTETRSKAKTKSMRSIHGPFSR